LNVVDVVVLVVVWRRVVVVVELLVVLVVLGFVVEVEVEDEEEDDEDDEDDDELFADMLPPEAETLTEPRSLSSALPETLIGVEPEISPTILKVIVATVPLPVLLEVAKSSDQYSLKELPE